MINIHAFFMIRFLRLKQWLTVDKDVSEHTSLAVSEKAGYSGGCQMKEEIPGEVRVFRSPGRYSAGAG
jgi:hypothetical protein